MSILKTLEAIKGKGEHDAAYKKSGEQIHVVFPINTEHRELYKKLEWTLATWGEVRTLVLRGHKEEDIKGVKFKLGNKVRIPQHTHTVWTKES